MAKIHIPCFVAKGARFYWQPSKTLADAGWKPLTLGTDLTAAKEIADQRNAEVAAWKAGGKPSEGITARPIEGTFGELVALYRAKRINGRKPNGAPLFAEKTRIVYETSLVRLEAWAAQRPLSWISRRRVEDLREASLAELGHAPAFNLLKMLRQVLAYGVKRELLAKNPAEDFELASPPPRRQVWEAEDEAGFIASAYELGLPSMALAMELAIFTAQRAGDLIRLSEPQLEELTYADSFIREQLGAPDGRLLAWCFAQRKTSDEYESTQMAIPFEPKLRARIEAALKANRARDRAANPPRLISRVLVDDRSGEPWNDREFSRCWALIREHAAARCKRPKMNALVWHDLRRTRVVRMRRRGMRAETIAALTGHSTGAIAAMLRVYGPVDPIITAVAVAEALSLDRAAQFKKEATA